MTVEDVANYCEIKECEARVGSPEAGFVPIDGTGVIRSGNYRRFLALNELASLPSPQEAVARATQVRLRDEDGERILTVEEFKAELARLWAALEA